MSRAATVLTNGRFFGNVRLREEHAGFALTQLRHARPARLPLHQHAQSWFCLVRSGGYAERYGREQVTYGPRSVLFHPPGIAHRDEIAPGGASFLIVELGETLLRRAAEHGAVGASRQDLRGGPLAQAALRLEREWRAPGGRSPLVMEGLVLEMLGLVTRTRKDDAREPAWLAAVVERLRADLAATRTIAALARDAGVHPVRLARAFRRHLGMGVGDYVRALRVRRIEERLGEDDATLADLALETGFTDQSHMTRVFRRVTGLTPGAARERARTSRASRDPTEGGIR